jgi:hypothetical protein
MMPRRFQAAAPATTAEAAKTDRMSDFNRILRARFRPPSDAEEREPREESRRFDYGAGPRGGTHGLGSARADGRTAMNGWIFDRSRELATRSDVVVVPTREM